MRSLPHEPARDSAKDLDCLIVGGGPAGLTAALYLARFKRRALVVDGGASRADWIPESHNIPLFAQGIAGSEILARQRETARRYGARRLSGTVSDLQKRPGGFAAIVSGAETGAREITARRVLLATGAADVEPDLPDLPNAVQKGLVRYCPICDGFEAAGKRVAVIGHGAHAMGEALFIARTYSSDVTLLTQGRRMELDPTERRELAGHGVRIVEEPVVGLELDGERIKAVRVGPDEGLRFDILYSALGLKCRSDLARALGARHDENGALLVDDHNQTSVKGLYAAGGVVKGLDQVVVAMGHAAVAATRIHNRCERPTEDEEQAPD